jgi:hypothetical protein
VDKPRKKKQQGSEATPSTPKSTPKPTKRVTESDEEDKTSPAGATNTVTPLGLKDKKRRKKKTKGNKKSAAAGKGTDWDRTTKTRARKARRRTWDANQIRILARRLIAPAVAERTRGNVTDWVFLLVFSRDPAAPSTMTFCPVPPLRPPVRLARAESCSNLI